MIKAVTAMPAPSGGAVKLVLHTTAEQPYALVLATTDSEVPDPVAYDYARYIYGGKLMYSHAPYATHALNTPHAYQVYDLQSGYLPDEQPVFYHVFEMLPGDKYGAPITLMVIPRCARTAAVVIARDTLKSRLRYHLDRAVADKLIRGLHDEIPIYEQEVREEGTPLPSIFVKESVSPNPSDETIGHHDGEFVDAMNPNGIRFYRFAYSARVDFLIMTDNPEVRTNLEAFIRGVMDTDRELFLAAGLNEPSVTSFTRHDVEEATGADLYGAEISVSCTVYTRIVEERGLAKTVTATA